MRGAGLAIIAVALAGCGSSHPAGPAGSPAPASSSATPEAAATLPPDGQQSSAAAATRACQVKAAGDFEGYLSFGLGLAAEGPHHVSTLTGPDRMVIDVSHAASR